MIQLPRMNPAKDVHDAGASPIIEISNGAKSDPRFFYSTTNSTTYKAYNNPTLKSPINGVHEKDLKPVGSTKIKQRTGYSKNILAFVKYDRNVDEDKSFRITAPFKPVTSDDFKSPGPLQNYLSNDKSGITPMVESGFTRLPKFKVTEDGTNHKEKETQMKSSYVESRLRFKSPSVDKTRILPSETAYINDAGEITSIGNPEKNSEFERFKIPLEVKYSECKVTKAEKMTDDGYTRSTRPRDPLRTEGNLHAEIDPRLLQNDVMENIRHKDIAEWVHRKDPAAEKSLSRTIHAPLDSLAALKSMSSGSVIGLQKEPTGALKNNPKFVFLPEPAPVERFTTETIRRFQPPKDKFNLETMKCDQITKSGFSHCNQFNYNFDAKSDAEIYRSMHPTVAKYNWIKERGLHTSKPNLNHKNYKLVVQ